MGLLFGAAIGLDVFGGGVEQCGCFGTLSVSRPAHFLILICMAFLSFLSLVRTHRDPVATAGESSSTI